MMNSDDLDFLQSIVHYLSTNNSLPLGISEPEAFLQKARCYFLRNKQLYFGIPNSSFRVISELNERQNLLEATHHLRDSMSKYHHVGKDFYWPNFDHDFGVFAQPFSAQYASVRVLNITMMPNHSVYLMIEEKSGFITGNVVESEQSSIADFIFKTFCHYGEWPQSFVLVDFDDFKLHNLKVDLAFHLKDIDTMKNRINLFSSFCTTPTMISQENELIHSLNDFIHANNKIWPKKFPGWIYNHNYRINVFSPTQIPHKTAQKRASNPSNQSNSSPKKKPFVKIPSLPNESSKKSTTKTQENTESVVSTVKSLLSVTKSERSRRGKYYKYDPEIRDAIAEFALAHGTTEASKHFTDQLDLKISSSTIRNFIKSYQAYTPEIKEEIGKYAIEHGSEQCYEHFKSRFDSKEKGEDSTFTLSLVNRFKKYYESKTTAAKNDDGSTRIFVVDIPVASEPGSTSEGPTKNFFNSELKNDIGQYAFHCGNKKTMEHFSHRLQFPMKESTVRKFKKRWMESNNIQIESSPSKTVKNGNSSREQIPESEAEKGVQESKLGEDKIHYKTNEEEEEEEVEEEEDLDEKNGQRLYSSYDPELRAKIAKYALTHSNKETASYFLSVHNKIVPRSTIRFLRDKYKAMDSNESDEMTQLDFGPRGRPTRLGCYDSILQKCIIDLAESGEKLTSFLVIATAKQVLLKYDPSLLKENGGPISLDPNWAKSILRRVQKSLRKSS